MSLGAGTREAAPTPMKINRTINAKPNSMGMIHANMIPQKTVIDQLLRFTLTIRA
jgi:hypothetical protein